MKPLQSVLATWQQFSTSQATELTSLKPTAAALQNVNYPGLRALYDKYKDQGFNLAAFPCNQFGGQAPGSSQQEREWAFRKFGFEFDVYVRPPGSTICHPPVQTTPFARSHLGIATGQHSISRAGPSH
jgi:hypothetical protein